MQHSSYIDFHVVRRTLHSSSGFVTWRVSLYLIYTSGRPCCRSSSVMWLQILFSLCALDIDLQINEEKYFSKWQYMWNRYVLILLCNLSLWGPVTEIYFRPLMSWKRPADSNMMWYFVNGKSLSCLQAGVTDDDGLTLYLMAVICHCVSFLPGTYHCSKIAVSLQHGCIWSLI